MAHHSLDRLLSTASSSLGEWGITVVGGCTGSLGELGLCQLLRRSDGVVGRFHELGYRASNH